MARYKLRIGRRINSATLIADTRHSWLDALSCAGAAAGLIGVLAGLRWADAAGLLVTGFICHVGWEVSVEVAHRLMDGVDPAIITTAETAAAQVPGVRHAHARARWTGRILRVKSKAGSTPRPPSRRQTTPANTSPPSYPQCARSPGPPAASNRVDAVPPEPAARRHDPCTTRTTGRRATSRSLQLPRIRRTGAVA